MNSDNLNASDTRKRYRILDSDDEIESVTPHQTDQSNRNESEQNSAHATNEISVVHLSPPTLSTNEISINSNKKRYETGELL